MIISKKDLLIMNKMNKVQKNKYREKFLLKKIKKLIERYVTDGIQSWHLFISWSNFIIFVKVNYCDNIIKNIVLSFSKCKKCCEVFIINQKDLAKTVKKINSFIS